MSRNTSKTRGAAMVTVLAFTIVLATIMAGVGAYAVGHLSRSHVEADYSSAVNVADAGINALLRKISLDPSDTSLVHQSSNPLTGTVPGVGSYSAYVEDYNTGGNWSAPNDMRIISTGTVNGVSRKVEARGVRKSIFDEYAIFADEVSTLGGAGNNSGTTQIFGNVGVNGPITFNGNLGTSAINGELTLNNGATSNTTGSNVVTSPDPVLLPSVDEIANLTFPGGFSYLRTNNSNSKILKLRSTNTSLSSITSKTGLTLAQVTLGDAACLFDSAGYTSTTYNWNEPGGSFPQSTNTNDSASAAAASRRFATATANDEIYNKRVMFLPPGDYYFEDVSFTQGNAAIVLLTHLGRIRIWVDDNQNRASINGNGDSLNAVVIFTDESPSKFRFFYNKCTTMNINGSSTFRGGFYSVNPGCTKGPTMGFGGNTTIYGSVISSLITLGGGTQIIFPNDGAGNDPTDYSLWFGFKNGWKEKPITTGDPTFVDGTSK